uniref:RRM domain-containing protein n=2 Tax=Alexandrium monilatum TaxID=311494 RepID=A0A7S4SDZ5_9DINO
MASAPEDDQNSGHKLFVGGLPPDCSQEELQMVFSTYGQLERVHMMPPKSKSGLRCAFVFYSKLESAEDAIKVLDGIYKIREDADAPIQVRWPRENRNDWGGGGDWGKGGGDWGKGGKGDWGKGGGWGHDGWGKGGDWGKDSWGKGGGKDHGGKDAGKGSEGSKLFVGSLPTDCTEQELNIVFTTYGEVKSVHLMQPHGKTGMRCAFVTYGKQESAEDAIKVLDNIYKIRENAEQPIQVRWANDRNKGGCKGGKDKGYGKGGKDGWQALGWDDGKGGSWKGGGSWGWQDGGWGGGWDAGWHEGGKGWGGCGKGGGWWDDDWNKGGKKGKKGDGKGCKGDFKGDFRGDFKGDCKGDYKGGKGGKADGGPEPLGHRVYVSNLPADIQQNAVEYVFGTYGKVQKVHIMSNKVLNGCVSAFVDFSTNDEVETAIASLHDKYEIRPGYGPIVVRHANGGKGRSKPY